MELFDYAHSDLEAQKGDLLISEPFLMDPNFSRTVILLCEHNEEGSFGFVLNKPSQMKLSDVLEDVENRKDKVYIGGPVQQNALQFIHKNQRLIEGGSKVREGIFWGGNFEQMLAMIDTDLIAVSDIKFFAGYSGWSSGQLKSELEVKSWIISRDFDIDQIFDTDVEFLWKAVLNTMGGKYKIAANFPEDPRLN